MMLLKACKKTTFLFLSGTILLSSSLATLAMEEKPFTTTAHLTARPQLKGIEIPSMPEDVGVKVGEYLHKEVEDSWGALSQFTEQTLHNFQQGPKNPRGILYVHSLEDIMGATECFTKMWNRSHPQDQRTIDKENFHEVFSSEEFVNNYIENVLAQRILISGSVLALPGEPEFTLRSTFSPVSFIFDVPKECVVVTSGTDARTPVYYAPLKGLSSQREVNFEDYVSAHASNRVTLDTLVRFPMLQQPTKLYHNEMNEVGILSCAQKGEQEFFRPKIVGVLINTSAPLPGFDYGNAGRNIEWIKAAKEFAKVNDLPSLQLNEQTPTTFTKEGAERITNEWFEGRTQSLFEYMQNREAFKTENEQNLINKLHSIFNGRAKHLESKLSDEEYIFNLVSEIVEEHPEFKEIMHLYVDVPGYVTKSQRYLLSDELLETYRLKRQ
ncbi:MAG TPA: hypothetical protein VMW10_05760 [Alphaproteobacteria bacterium]|nr:hypothetical protein [Alphaproteobacteria bacterium]